jgi:Na+/glutamate symporter
MFTSRAAFFLAGVVAAPALAVVGRPLARGIIKGGIVAKRHLDKMAAEVMEQVQDLAAEAEADLNTPKS